MIKLKGLIAAPYTPFSKSGELNISKIPVYAEYLKNSGVSGVFVNGTTGEGTSLSEQERYTCAEAWNEQKADDFKIIIHVGHNSIKVAKGFAKHAVKIGADAIGLMPSNFFKPESLSNLILINTEVAAAAPDLPYYYYHMPAMSGINFSMLEFLKAAESQIPNLAGIKFTHENLMDMKQCIEYENRKFDILHGRDEILICGLALGAKGAIGSTYNYMSPLFVKILEKFKQSDLDAANIMQMEAIKIIDILIKYGGAIKAGKSFMRYIGMDFGQPRLPVLGLSLEEENRLHKELKAIGFLKIHKHFESV